MSASLVDRNTTSCDDCFSIDLVALAKEHLEFLQKIHISGASVTRPPIESLRRYRDLWLPLVYENRDKGVQLVPPADVAWLWHCHRLAPFQYADFLEAKFGSECPILEPRPSFSVQGCVPDDHLEGRHIYTKVLWDEMYPEEPFSLSKSFIEYTMSSKDPPGALPPTPPEWQVNGFDLIAATDRQATFLWQVSGTRFSDEEFLREGLQNYYKFLQLQHDTPQQQMVPTYQIELLWRTHMLASLHDYNEDCCSIVGTTLDHDDRLSDGSRGVLDTTSNQTRRLWMQKYEEEYFVPGGMYRGEPPEQYFRPSWPASKYNDLMPSGQFLKSMAAQCVNHDTCRDEDEKDEEEPNFFPPRFSAGYGGVTDNPTIPNYIFGQGPAGLGYYHTSTPEASDLLLKRVEVKIEEEEHMVGRLQTLNELLFFCGPKTFSGRKEMELEELKLSRDILKARFQSTSR